MKETETSPHRFASKRLTLPGLKPTDYFLFAQAKEFFNFDTREVLVLGLRVLYAGLHGQISREQILTMATQIAGENLTTEPEERPVYKRWSSLG